MVDKIRKYDIHILHFINDTLRCKILDIVMPIVTFFGSATFSALFTILTLTSNNKLVKQLGILTSLSIITSGAITQLIKRYINRLRPYINFPNINTKKIGVDDYSFPSGHTTAAFSIGISIAITFTSLGLISILLAFLVGISRIYLGVHYPTDVIAGILVGTCSSILIYMII